RTIISDIALYNKEKVLEGIKNDKIFELLEEELNEGAELFSSRVDPEFARKSNIFNRAIVDILIKKSGDIQSDIW
ncbi:MAG: hypothetical protein ACE5GF_09745, partial [Thermodesulfobacteriota bacterium]